MADLIGQSLGRYHILEQLGEGGMATVYKAYDTRLERDVAVKIIRRGAFPPDQLERILKRFEREAKALAKLSHPNIVRVYDFGDYEGSPYLVMEYLQGGTLKQRLGEPLDWQEAIRILLPIAHALQYAHSKGMVHRDVKPSNILITQSGNPMLTDFGIAKILETGETQTLTGTGVGIGTPEYMAPEQGKGEAIDARVDVYSLGIILYEMVTGRKPYIADTPLAVIIKHVNDPLPRPKQLVPNIPVSVEMILVKALEKRPQDRYQSMDELAHAMQGISQKGERDARGKPINGDTTTWMDGGGKKTPYRKNNWIWAIVAMVALLIITIGVSLAGVLIDIARQRLETLDQPATASISFTSQKTQTSTQVEALAPTLTLTSTHTPLPTITNTPTNTSTSTPSVTPLPKPTSPVKYYDFLVGANSDPIYSKRHLLQNNQYLTCYLHADYWVLTDSTYGTACVALYLLSSEDDPSGTEQARVCAGTDAKVSVIPGYYHAKVYDEGFRLGTSHHASMTCYLP